MTPASRSPAWRRSSRWASGRSRRRAVYALRRVDDAVCAGLEDLIDLAPLHNPHNLAAFTAARAVLGPGVPQVAVFDTAFHHSLPESAYIYAIPYQFYRR